MARASDDKKRAREILELNQLRKDVQRMLPAVRALRDIRHEAQNAEIKHCNLRNGWIIQRATQGLLP